MLNIVTNRENSATHFKQERSAMLIALPRAIEGIGSLKDIEMTRDAKARNISMNSAAMNE